GGQVVRLEGVPDPEGQTDGDDGGQRRAHSALQSRPQIVMARRRAGPTTFLASSLSKWVHDPRGGDTAQGSSIGGGRVGSSGRRPGGERRRACVRAAVPNPPGPGPQPVPAHDGRGSGGRPDAGRLRARLAEAGDVSRRGGLRDVAAPAGGERDPRPPQGAGAGAGATEQRPGGARRPDGTRGDAGDDDGLRAGDRPPAGRRQAGVPAARRRGIPARRDRHDARHRRGHVEVAIAPRAHGVAEAPGLSKEGGSSTMSDNWTARLSEYLDETLAPAERHGRRPAGPVFVAGTAAPPVWLSAMKPNYDRTVTELEGALDEGRRSGRLDSTTVRVLERSLATIDTAIAQASRALAQDPGNLYLNHHLAETMRRKLDLLRQASGITQRT